MDVFERAPSIANNTKHVQKWIYNLIFVFFRQIHNKILLETLQHSNNMMDVMGR